MQRALKRRAALAFWLMLAASPLSGGEPLRMQLFPAVAREPAVLTVRVTVEAADDNRARIEEHGWTVRDRPDGSVLVPKP